PTVRPHGVGYGGAGTWLRMLMTRMGPLHSGGSARRSGGARGRRRLDTVAEPLRVLCLSPDSTIAAGVAAMFASLPDFTLATRTVGYEEGLRDLREPDLAVVVLEDD